MVPAADARDRAARSIRGAGSRDAGPVGARAGRSARRAEPGARGLDPLRARVAARRPAPRRRARTDRGPVAHDRVQSP
ncbi:hypothetical protein RZS08_63715, partial [Arthrospira platensis SPKY1]|nr:hypothetical protein [Arthrospira platensis SPKY1]